MVFVSLNCVNIATNNSATDILNCTWCDHTHKPGDYTFEKTAVSVSLLMSLVGVFLNPLCFYVLYSTNTNNNKFLHLLKYYCLNSFMINLNDLIHNILFILLNTETNYVVENFTDENNKYYESYDFIYYKTKVYFPVWIVLYTLASFLDICIAYQRLQIYIPKLTLLERKSPRLIMFLCVLSAILINLPSIGVFDFETTAINIDGSDTIYVYIYKIRAFVSHTIFNKYLLLNTFIRDVLSILLKLALNAALITWTFSEKKVLENRQSRFTNSFKNKRRNILNNSMIVFFIGSFSLIIHSQVYAIVLMVLMNQYTRYLNEFITILMLSNTLKHAYNIFTFYNLNRKFKNQFLKYLPEFMVQNKRRIGSQPGSQGIRRPIARHGRGFHQQMKIIN